MWFEDRSKHNTKIHSEKRSTVKALNCISLLTVIIGNRVSFFHKSVMEWLVSEIDYVYKINAKHGHVVLAKLFTQRFADVLKTTDLERSMFKLTDVEEYAFQNGFYHMLSDVPYDVCPLI